MEKVEYTHVDDHADLELMAPMVTVNIKHEFSPEELKKEGEVLAQLVSDKQLIENEKKVAMTVFKNRIETCAGEINLHSSNINYGFTYHDVAAEMYRDWNACQRVYFDKQTGNFIKSENFHPSDFQKKLDFEAEEEKLRLADIERQKQIEANNSAWDYAEGRSLDDDIFAPIDDIIVNKNVQQIPREETFNPDGVKLGSGPDGTFLDQHGNITEFDSEELPI